MMAGEESRALGEYGEVYTKSARSFRRGQTLSPSAAEPRVASSNHPNLGAIPGDVLLIEDGNGFGRRIRGL